MTNFERIKQMNVEEFAKMYSLAFPCDLCEKTVGCTHHCTSNFVKWLNEEAKEQPNDKDK